VAATDVYLRCFVDIRRGLPHLEVLPPIFYENTPTFRAVIKATASDGVGIEAYNLTSKVIKILARRIPQGAGLVTAQLTRASQQLIAPVGFPNFSRSAITYREGQLDLLDSAWEETMTIDTPATAGTAYWTPSQSDTQRTGNYLLEVREENPAGTTQLVLGLFVLPIILAGEGGTLGLYL